MLYNGFNGGIIYLHSSHTILLKAIDEKYTSPYFPISIVVTRVITN